MATDLNLERVLNWSGRVYSRYRESMRRWRSWWLVCDIRGLCAKTFATTKIPSSKMKYRNWQCEPNTKFLCLIPGRGCHCLSQLLCCYKTARAIHLSSLIRVWEMEWYKVAPFCGVWAIYLGLYIEGQSASTKGTWKRYQCIRTWAKSTCFLFLYWTILGHIPRTIWWWPDAGMPTNRHPLPYVVDRYKWWRPQIAQ